MKKYLFENDEDTLNLADQWSAERVREYFSRTYRRGWQRKLARNLGVADSTVSGWLSSGDLPLWARLAIASLSHRSSPDEPSMRSVRTDEGFAIYSFDTPVGELRAQGVQRVADAYMFAAAPMLLKACETAHWILAESDFDGVWPEYIE